jgi:chemotaxis protein methyltransferase WspC
MNKHQNEIERLLARRIGLDPVAMGPHLVVRAARRRMAALGLDDLGDYVSRVLQSESELQELIEEVVVPESWFFRDDRPFRWLAEYVRQRWVGDPARRAMRILSLPCAGGEEPYSIAMTLKDVGLPARRFHIDAADVSARRLAVAQRGLYSANAFRGSELGSRAQFFRAHGGDYEVDPAIRAMVRFFQASALDPALLAASPPYDIVFCRNLLIYLDAPARGRLLATLDRLLADDGHLFIGHADRLDISGEPARFSPAGEPGNFVYRKARGQGAASSDGPVDQTPAADRELTRPAQPSTVGLVAAPDTRLASGRQSAAAESRHPVRHASPAGADPLTEGRSEPNLDRTPAGSSTSSLSSSDLLVHAADLANQGRHAEAIAMCERHLRQRGPGPSAYYLMGMICQAAGDRHRAEECFHKTAYLDPKHDEALLALALLAEHRGDRQAAAGFRRRASKRASAARPEGGERR